MKNLQNQLKTVSKKLAELSNQIDRISSQIEKTPAAKTSTAKKQVVKKTAAKKTATAGGKTVLDTVYDAIKRSKKGVTVAQLKTKTQLDARQLSNALYKLSKKGMVQAPSRGLYLKK